MRLTILAAAAAATFLSTSVLADDADSKNPVVPAEFAAGDWSQAEAALMNADVAPGDEVFAKLNLAFVYSTTGRRDQAVALYQEILASKENPYALTMAGEPRRVKTIAKVALNRLEGSK
ncbi:MAG: tetratricopeptide repeat protein [Alphaproteobacteria bacterium]|nr:MAG: tetratricopeptide repeat protein [Alphaproteobacteria bacterium]